jgi:hypothetical protein
MESPIIYSYIIYNLANRFGYDNRILNLFYNDYENLFPVQKNKNYIILYFINSQYIVMRKDFYHICVHLGKKKFEIEIELVNQTSSQVEKKYIIEKSRNLYENIIECILKIRDEIL